MARSKILELYDEGNSIQRIAYLTDIDERIVRMLLNEYKALTKKAECKCQNDLFYFCDYCKERLKGSD